MRSLKVVMSDPTDRLFVERHPYGSHPFSDARMALPGNVLSGIVWGMQALGSIRRDQSKLERCLAVPGVDASGVGPIGLARRP